MEKKRINYARSAGRGRDERPFSLREGGGGVKGGGQKREREEAEGRGEG